MSLTLQDKTLLHGCSDELNTQSKAMKPLPNSYTTVPIVSSLPKNIAIPECRFTIPESNKSVSGAVRDEYNWSLTVASVVAANS